MSSSSVVCNWKPTLSNFDSAERENVPCAAFYAALALLHRVEESHATRSKELSTVAVLGFQFGLYHDVVPLSLLRSISLASLVSSLSIFG